MKTLQDLIEEAKIRFVWWTLCIFAICYFISHTSKSMWMNIPMSVLIAFGLRILMNAVEFRHKVSPIRKQTNLSYLEKKQLPLNDPRLSTAPPPQRWRKKIDSPIVQAAVEEFIDLILRDFVVDLWYSDITPDKEAPALMRAIILDALGEVTGRVKEVNLVELLTRDMIDLVGDHIELYRRNQASIGVDVMMTLSSEERDERLKHNLMAANELHPALVSAEHEYKFLRQLMDGLITLVLRQREAQCPLVRTIAREFLTNLVIQPIMNLASPVYINELIEFIILNLDGVLNPGLKKTEATDHSSKSSKDSSVALESVHHGQSTSGKTDSSRRLQTEMNSEKDRIWREKVIEASHSSSLDASRTHLKTAEWARVLDAATQRRSEVLAPENLENMWARGRNYKEKLNKSAKKTQAMKGLPSADIAHSRDLETAITVNKSGNKGVDVKTMVRNQQTSNIVTPPKSGETHEFQLSRNLEQESASSLGFLMEDAYPSVVYSGGAKNRLKRSNSASMLKIEPDVKRPNTSESKGIIISEFYNSDFGKPDTDLRSNSTSDLLLDAEVSHTPKLRCRVRGAFFEKIDSKAVAVYSIAVTDSKNNTWLVRRRYRNFERLHRQLKDIPNYTLNLPPKRIFSSNTEDAFVNQRCIQLNKYLQGILSTPNVAEQHEVWDFLSESSQNYSFGKSASVMKTLAVNVDDAVDDFVRQVKGVLGSSVSHPEPFQSVPQKHLSLNRDDYMGPVQSSSRRIRSSSEDEEVDKDQHLEEGEFSAEGHGWHSDNELTLMDLSSTLAQQMQDCRSLETGKKNSFGSSSEPRVTSRAASLPTISDHTEGSAEAPPEWTPPNVCVPVLNLVDKIFQLKRRGWLRRQVFWMSKQILQLVMEDAIDDFLLEQIHWLRRDDVIAQGIRWLKNFLWPGGKFFMKLELSPGKSDGLGYKYAPKHASHSGSSKLSQSGSFESQLEAVRRANDVKKLLYNGAPTALVGLVGNKQYKHCARDIYYFLQSSVCIKQLAYGGMEQVIISIFPELRELVVDTHKKMRTQAA